MSRMLAATLALAIAMPARAQTTTAHPPAPPPPPAAPATNAASSARPPAPPAAPAAAPAAVPADTAVLPPQEIGTILVGQTRNGLLEVGDYTMGDATWADVWYVNLTAGQHITIDLSSSQFDPYVQFLDPWGGKLGEDDDSGPGNSSRFAFTAHDAGRYQIVVNSSGDSPKTGRYVLQVH